MTALFNPIRKSMKWLALLAVALLAGACGKSDQTVEGPA